MGFGAEQDIYGPLPDHRHLSGGLIRLMPLLGYFTIPAVILGPAAREPSSLS